MNHVAQVETPDFRVLFEAAPALLIVLAPDSQFTILAASDAYLRATLIRREDVVGRGMFEVFPDNPDNPDDPSATGTASLRASLQRALRDRRPDAMPIQKYDIRKPASEGGGFEERYWSPTNYPVYAADGTCTCIIHRAEDVTEYVRMGQQRQEQSKLADELRRRSDTFEVEIFQRAREVEEANARLREANAEVARLYERTRELDALKTQFFANVSHELRTPLALVLGPVRRLLASADLPAESALELRVVERNTRLLLKHVNDLLDIAKLDAGALSPQYSTLDVAGLVRFVASHFEVLAAERGLRLELDLPERLPAQLDAARTQRVLLNLLSNAFKFTPEAGRITVSARTSGDRVRIAVEDTGPGVPEALREAIFERFRQGEDSLTRKVGGTGLGLHIVREFVRLQGGDVLVQEASGGGALFVVELPARAPAGVPVAEGQDVLAEAAEAADIEMLALQGAAPAAAQGVEGQSGIAGGAHVLVVDDNRDMNEFVARTLAGSHRVSRAHDGAEALRIARADVPDLILTDLMLPGMSGEELLSKLRADPLFDQVPVMLLTARADDAMRVRLLQAGAQDYLSKPFNPEELQARVARLVEERRERQVAERDSLAKLHAHLGRLSLLQQITRAIGDRQDFPSICQVVLRTLEDRMPLDFACMGQHAEGSRQLLDRPGTEGRGARARRGAGRRGPHRHRRRGHRPLPAGPGRLRPGSHAGGFAVCPAAHRGRPAFDGRGAGQARKPHFRRADRRAPRGALVQQQRMRVPGAAGRARGAGGEQPEALRLAARGVRRPAHHAAVGDAAGAAARAGRDGQRHRPRHQQFHYPGRAVPGRAAREGRHAAGWRGRSPADHPARGERRGGDGVADARVLPAARAAAVVRARAAQRAGAAGGGPDPRTLERHAAAAGHRHRPADRAGIAPAFDHGRGP